jgi:Rieske 2Fe-2S family protein
MSGATTAGANPAAWNGLTTLERTLPASFYRDPAHHARRAGSKIWYRNWIYVCRAQLPWPSRSRSGFSMVGSQQILLVRDDAGMLRGFHNTCRHRGSPCCAREAEGKPARSPRITCPYHSWSVSPAPVRWCGHRRPPRPAAAFDPALLYPLYGVAL